MRELRERIEQTQLLSDDAKKITIAFIDNLLEEEKNQLRHIDILKQINFNLSKDLEEAKEQLRVSRCWENFSNWVENNYEADDDYMNHFFEKDRRGQAFSRGIDWAELRRRYSELNNL